MSVCLCERQSMSAFVCACVKERSKKQKSKTEKERIDSDYLTGLES